MFSYLNWTRFPYVLWFPCLVWGRMNKSSTAVSRFFEKGLILEQFDAMVMNIANSHRLSEANVWGIVFGASLSCKKPNKGPGKLLNVLLVRQFGLGKVVNFEVKIPSLFLVNPFFPAGTCFFTGVRCTLPGFGQRGRGRSPYFLSPQLKQIDTNCPALLRCEVKNQQKV